MSDLEYVTGFVAESSTGADGASEAGNVPDLDVGDCNDGARDEFS